MRSTGLYILDLMSLDSLLFDLMYYDQGLNKMQVRKYGSMVEWVSRVCRKEGRSARIKDKWYLALF